MDPLIAETGLKIKSTELASTLGLMVDPTRENGLRTIWKGSVCTLGAMAGTTKANISTTRSMVTGCIAGKTQGNILGTGRMESNMASVNTLCLKMPNLNLAYGKTARG